jgi:HEAT repeat protein
MRHVISAALILGLFAVPVWAHGGQYKGPSDAGGPAASGGANSAPPTNPGGAAAPGPGAPATAAGATAASTGGQSQRGKSKRGATTGGGQLDFGAGFEIWEFWWENNKDQYLNLKERLQGVTSTTGSSGHLTGRGRKTEARSSRRPSQEKINADVLPALDGLLKDSDNRDILDSAILAMARAAREDSAQLVLDAALPMIGHNELSVQTSSTLALGVLGSPKALSTLNELLADSSKGRQIAGGRGEVPWLVRAFAALSLGLINQPDSVSVLTDLVANTADSDRDIKVTAIVALGLMQNDQATVASRFLIELLDDRSLDAIIKSYVPTSLAKLHSGLDNVDPSVLAKMLETFTNRDTDNYVRQSAAIAMGLLGSVENEDVIKTLVDYIAEGKDMQTRHFCFISLAQIGRRDENEQAHREVHDGLRDLFADEITKPSTQTNRSWAAISAAIYAQKQLSAQPFLVERLIQAYDKEKDPSFKAAFALSLGLLKISPKAPDIYEDFAESKDDDFRGYAAVALGFMNYTDAAETLRAICENKTITPTYRLQVATGLGLMGDPEANQVLIRTLESAQTLGVSSAVAKALGLIGDQTAIDPLKRIALDEKIQAITRAFACVALGIVCEKTDLPWNARISADNNYRARVPAIDEVLDIL